MKALKQNRLAMTAMMTAALVMVLATQSAAQAAAANQDPKIQTPMATHKRVIVVSLEDRKLALVEDGKVIKTYRSRWASRRPQVRWALSPSSAA